MGEFLDAKTLLYAALPFLGNASLAIKGIYPKRALWSSYEGKALHEYKDFCDLSEGADIVPIVKRIWLRVKKRLPLEALFLIKIIKEKGPVTGTQLSKDSELKHITLSERIFSELIQLELINEIKYTHSELGVDLLAYH